MGLGPEHDPGDVRILITPCRTALRTLLFRILPARSLLLPLFLERLLAYTLRLCRSGSICHPLHFKGSGQSRVPQPAFTATSTGTRAKSGGDRRISRDVRASARQPRFTAADEPCRAHGDATRQPLAIARLPRTADDAAIRPATCAGDARPGGCLSPWHAHPPRSMGSAGDIQSVERGRLHTWRGAGLSGPPTAFQGRRTRRRER